MKMNQLAEQVIGAVKGYLQAQLAPLVERLAAVEARAPVDGKDGAPGADGKDGAPGKDGENGRDGADGQDGRDAIELEVRPGIDESRSYPPRTYAFHKGGLWVSRRKTRGMDGWECGIPGIWKVEEREVDARTVERVTTLSNGEETRVVWKKSGIKDCGVYRAEDDYDIGDGVTWAGSYWLAQRAKPGKPGDPDSGWRLAVKKGRDGRDGERGQKGDKGDPGRPGRDLTQMAFDGTKT